jgi:hypothetical protein
MKWVKHWLRRIALSLLVLLLALATLTAHAVAQGEDEMTQSDAAFNRGDVRLAAHHARRAAVSYAPGAPHVRAAFQRLEAVARGAEANGEHDVALFAWRAMRSAALETQHVTRPFEAELMLANQALARLQVSAATPTTTREAVRLGKIAERDLERDRTPRASWIALLTLGFLAALGGLGWFSVQGVRADGAIRWSVAKWGASLAILGALCWTWAVVHA